MAYAITINAPVGFGAVDMSAISKPGETRVVPRAKPEPIRPDLPQTAPQIKDLHARRGREENFKQKTLARMPAGWLGDVPDDPQPAEMAGPEPMALYRRYSTLDQKESSFDRQAGGVENYARNNNGYIRFLYEDKGKSGAYKAGRDGLLRMMRDAKQGLFKKLILEFGNRLARDLGLTSSVFRELRSYGVEIHTPQEGKWHLLHAAFNGVMGEEAREQLKMWTRAGIERCVLDAKWPGRPAYAFKKVLGFPGEMEVVDEEADVVRDMFGWNYVGIPPAEIQRILNSKGIPSPEGKLWSITQVCAILRNPIYIGLIFYFRTKTETIETDTYRLLRKVEKTAISKWRIAERVDWRIVDVEVWNTVQRHLRPRSKGRRRVAKRILSGLLYCGHCDSPLHFHARRTEHVRMYCSDRARSRDENYKKKAKGCSSSTTVLLQCIEIVVLNAAAERLAVGGVHAIVEQAHKESLGRRFKDSNAERIRLEKARDEIVEKLKATFEAAYTKSMPEFAIGSLREDLNAKFERNAFELAAVPVAEVHDHPLLKADFGKIRHFLEQFPYCKDFDGTDLEEATLVAQFQALIERVEVKPISSRSFDLTIRGPLAHIGSKESNPTLRISARDVELKVPRGRAELEKERFRKEVRFADLAITDDEWRAMAPHLPREPIWIEGHPEPIELRTVLNLHLFRKRKNVDFSDMLASRRASVFMGVSIRLLRFAIEVANYWHVIDLFADVAGERAPRLLEGINVRMRGRRSGKFENIPSAFDRRNLLKKPRALDPTAICRVPTRFDLDTVLD
ncbi:recombinase family protein [Bradyrhizobium sp. USDA 4502]